MVPSYLVLFFIDAILDAMEYAETQNAIFIETSAKTAVNVGTLFVEISKSQIICILLAFRVAFLKTSNWRFSY